MEMAPKPAVLVTCGFRKPGPCPTTPGTVPEEVVVKASPLCLRGGRSKSAIVVHCHFCGTRLSGSRLRFTELKLGDFRKVLSVFWDKLQLSIKAETYWRWVKGPLNLWGQLWGQNVRSEVGNMEII